MLDFEPTAAQSQPPFTSFQLRACMCQDRQSDDVLCAFVRFGECKLKPQKTTPNSTVMEKQGGCTHFRQLWLQRLEVARGASALWLLTLSPIVGFLLPSFCTHFSLSGASPLVGTSLQSRRHGLELGSGEQGRTGLLASWHFPCLEPRFPHKKMLRRERQHAAGC